MVIMVRNVGECFIGTNSCYGCGKGGHMVKYFPNVRIQSKGNNQAKLSGASVEAPKRKRFYALKARGEQERSPDVVTGYATTIESN